MCAFSWFIFPCVDCHLKTCTSRGLNILSLHAKIDVSLRANLRSKKKNQDYTSKREKQ